MDLSIALISLGLFGLSALVVYFVSVVSFREKTYEELKEERLRHVEKLYPDSQNHKEAPSGKAAKEKPTKKKSQKKTQVKERSKKEGSKESHLETVKSLEKKIVQDESALVNGDAAETGPHSQEEKKKVPKKDKAKPTGHLKEKPKPVEEFVHVKEAREKQKSSEKMSDSKNATKMDSQPKLAASPSHRAAKQKVSETDGPAPSRAHPARRTSPSDSPRKQKTEVTALEQQPQPHEPTTKTNKGKTLSAGSSPSNKPIQLEPETVMVNGELATMEDGETLTIISVQPLQAANEIVDTNARPQREGRRKRKQPKQDRTDEVEQANLEEMSSSGLLLLSEVRKAALTDQEIQTMIDALLNKHLEPNPESEWIKSGPQSKDTITYLKKQLTDQDKLLADQRELCQSTQVKLRDLRNEYNEEKVRFSQSKRNLDEMVTKTQQEVQAMQSGYRIAQEKHTTEKQTLQQQIKQYQEQAVTHKQLQEENGKLQQTIATLEQGKTQDSQHHQQEMETLKVFHEKLSSDYTSCQQDNLSLKSQNHQLEEHIRKLEMKKEEDSSLHSQLHHLTTNYQQSEKTNSRLSADLQLAQDSCRMLEFENRDLKERIVMMENSKNKEEFSRKLEELEKHRSNVENQLKDVASKLSESNQRHLEKDAELKRLCEQNEMLGAQVSAFTQRPAVEGQETDGIAEEQLQKKGGGDLEDNYQVIINEKDALLTSLNSELNIQKEMNNKLQESFDVQRKKNNELREKNWKAMEALSATEKSLENSRKQSENVVHESVLTARLAEQETTRVVLQNLFPAIVVEDEGKKEFSSWVCKFESAAQLVLRGLTEKSQELRAAQDHGEGCGDHEDQISRLQGQVSQYQDILAKTEGMLKHLQSSVEMEEGVWQQRLKEKETRIVALVRERDSLAAKNHTLEESFEQVRAAQEMQAKLRELQQKLAGEEEEKADLAKKFDESHRSCSDLQAQLSRTSEQLATVDDLQQQVADLQAKLDSESESLKSAVLQKVQLGTLIQTAQEALLKEQELTSRLQQELEQAKSPSATANGPSSETASVEHSSKK